MKLKTFAAAAAFALLPAAGYCASSITTAEDALTMTIPAYISIVSGGGGIVDPTTGQGPSQNLTVNSNANFTVTASATGWMGTDGALSGVQTYINGMPAGDFTANGGVGQGQTFPTNYSVNGVNPQTTHAGLATDHVTYTGTASY